jgi:predicted nucleic acid-binding Zn ribbon protein
MWIACEADRLAGVGQHPFETEDGTNWRYYEEGVGTVGDSFKLHKIQNDEGKTICPRCGSEIKKAGAY